MSGISVKLPLALSARHGPYLLHTNLKSMVKQNLKMLVLTIPGERVMDPDFGVGLQRYLFENDTPDLRSKISDRISKQVRKYMPFLKVKQAILPNREDVPVGQNQKITIAIKYTIEDLSEEDVLNISLSPTDSKQNVF